MEDFRYRVRHVEGSIPVSVIDAEGALDSYTSEKLQQVFKELFADAKYCVVLNFQGLKYMSSAGIGLIVEQMEVARAHQGDIKLAHIPQKIEKVLDICGATKLLEVCRDEETAVKRFGQETIVARSSDFPREVTCPACQHAARIPSSDLYKCTKCTEVFYVDAKGAATSLKKIEGGEAKTLSRKIEMNIQSDLNFVQSIKTFIRDVIAKDGFQEDHVADVELAVDEALTNVVEHAYQFDDSRFMGVTLVLEDERLVVTVTDFGKVFAPKESATEEVVDDFTKRLRRGRGRLLIKKLMDEVEYETIPGVQNKLVMVKYRKKDPRGGFVPLSND